MVPQGSPTTLDSVDTEIALTNPEYGMIMIVIAIVVVPIAGIAFARSGSALKTLGKGRFAIETESAPRPPGLTGAEGERSTHAVEVRQMLEAKSYRRIRRGEPALDIEAEMRRLLKPAAADEQPEGPAWPPDAGASVSEDSSLREELRQHVIARNERRARQGREPLDVETEIGRRLREF